MLQESCFTSLIYTFISFTKNENTLIQQNTEEILRENNEKRAEAALFIQLLHWINSKSNHNAAKLDGLDYYWIHYEKKVAVE